MIIIIVSGIFSFSIIIKMQSKWMNYIVVYQVRPIDDDDDDVNGMVILTCFIWLLWFFVLGGVIAKWTDRSELLVLLLLLDDDDVDVNVDDDDDDDDGLDKEGGAWIEKDADLLDDNVYDWDDTGVDDVDDEWGLGKSSNSCQS